MNAVPHQTFFNLPLEKKQRLIAAIEAEFANTSLASASISNIIKAAEIPRGSFYQYFDDKEDAFFFVLNEHMKKISNTFIHFLKMNEGDIFLTLQEFYRGIISDEENFPFYKNAFLDMTYKIENAFAKMISNDHLNENYREIMPLIDKSKLNFNNEKELFHIMQIIGAITSRNVIQTFAQKLSVDQSLDNYITELKLLKQGFIKHS